MHSPANPFVSCALTKDTHDVNLKKKKFKVNKTGVMAGDLLVFWCLTNYELAFFNAISNKKTKENSGLRVGG